MIKGVLVLDPPEFFDFFYRLGPDNGYGSTDQIEPFSSLVNTVKSTVPRLLLNRDPVGPFEQRPLRRGDYMELGDLSYSVRKLAGILRWHTEIQDLMNSHENGLCSYPDPSNSSGENSYSSETDTTH